MTDSKQAQFLKASSPFANRHIGPSDNDVREMVADLGVESLDTLIDEAVPRGIRMSAPLDLPGPREEHELLIDLKKSAEKNRVFKSYLGLGYYDCIVPPVIQRNILENPGWYTQYTPYQAEISQGRLEALLNFQTMISDLTGLPLANASLLDEATAAAEAMHMAWAIGRGKRNTFFVSERCHPQTLAVLRTRAEAIGIDITVGDHATLDLAASDIFGCLIQYPATDGAVLDYESFAKNVHDNGSLLIAACDLLALTLLRAPGEFGVDIAIGSSQRFGVPLGYGGPHAAFMSTADKYKRNMPGRIIGVSIDSQGNRALRMALQTREQHIRRDKATSNICTAQVLLAIMAGMYATYHGPAGLKRIAERVHGLTKTLAAGLAELGHKPAEEPFFDTLSVTLVGASVKQILEAALAKEINLRATDNQTICIALDELTTAADLETLFEIFGKKLDANALAAQVSTEFAAPHARTSDYLTHPVFSEYHSEHEMLRYIYRLQGRDLSLTTSMIALGSCTMKLNATSEMLPVTWGEYANMHPFAPLDQAEGYRELFTNLESSLCEITGFAAVSLQPNAGSQGEFSGLLTIRAYHRAAGDHDRNICLIPTSAHGTNPASAVMCGMKVVVVACDDDGNIDVADLTAKAEKYKDTLAALMVTYPSTHGVFEEAIKEICATIHANGGLVYMDGANMNAQVGLCRPGDIGADVCHLNLHKTFCIPHGGGGPGMGPIGVVERLAKFLPGHPLIETGGDKGVGAVSAAPWGSPSILPISMVYIALMGGTGLTQATRIAILSANYMAEKLSDHYPVLYRGARGRVGHEFIIDLRPFEKTADVAGEDVAKRLMDYGFHAPTMSFPVTGTLMIEPTESESKVELDRFCDAMILIREEIRDIEEGRLDAKDNPLINAPHTASEVTADKWEHSYSRERAAFPADWVRANKFWPYVGRIDNGYGDKHLICTCPPIEAYEEDESSQKELPAATSPA